MRRRPSRGHVALLAALVVVILASAGVVGWYFMRFDRFSSSDAIQAFRDAQLEIGDVTPIDTNERQGLTPPTDREGVRFLIPSLGPDNGGRVFSFETQQDLETKRNYYYSPGRSPLIPFTWVFVHHNLLVQINGTLPRAEAIRYRDALMGL